MKIGIAGVGGIGSNMAVNLVRSGISSLRLVDMDCVEESNLNRQFYFFDQIGQKKVTALARNLKRIEATAFIETIHKEITRENCHKIFADCDFLIEGVDDEKTKKLLLEEMAPKVKLIVSASGIAGRDLQWLRCRRLENCAIVGDFASDCNSTPLYSHKLQAVCARMTEILLEEIDK